MLGLSRDNNNKVQHRDQDVVKKRLRNLDRFQICLAACRTSSASVRHENTVHVVSQSEDFIPRTRLAL